MNNFTTILNTIRRPFQQERRKGCRDDVVVNGLGSYVQLWVKNGDALGLETTEKEVLHNLADLFKNYTSASPTERQRTLEEATKRIDTALERNPQSHSGLETPPTKRKKRTNSVSAALSRESEPPEQRAAKAGTHNRTHSSEDTQRDATTLPRRRGSSDTNPKYRHRKNRRHLYQSQIFPFQQT